MDQAQLQETDEGPERHDPIIGRVEVNPAVMLGKPVIKSTRITVEHILRKLAGGMTVQEIVADHPRLTPDDVYAAVAYAADCLAQDVSLDKMQVRYFEQADILHVVLADEPESGSVEVRPGITAELNAEGELIGVEILNASSYLEVASAMETDATGLTRKMRMLAAVKLYKLGRLSSGCAAELAGVPRVEFLLALGRYKVCPFETELRDLEDATQPEAQE
jgi:uncharacterized protein (DUF433 family)/uncharacterized protein YuzE